MVISPAVNRKAYARELRSKEAKNLTPELKLKSVLDEEQRRAKSRRQRGKHVAAA